MELDLETYHKIELIGWVVAIFITFVFFGHFFVFIAIAIGVRHLYMLLKKFKLGLLPTEGKSVVVTGCDSGFGLGIANRLHSRGFKVFATCLDPNSEGATSLKDLHSDRIKVIHLDVTSDEMVAKCLETVKAECDHTGLWGLVNNAGQDFMGDAELSTMDQYLKVANINLFGMVRMCKAFLPLIRQAKGRILTVSSGKGLMAVPLTAPYTMAKFGVEAFSDVLRQEMATFDVTVVVIEPGNYGGLTGCLNDTGIARLSRDLEIMWKEASPELQQLYGEDHNQRVLDDARKGAKTTHNTMEPILDAFEDALRNASPHMRYLVPGSNTLIDIFAALARILPFTPRTLFERLRAYFFPYVGHPKCQ